MVLAQVLHHFTTLWYDYMKCNKTENQVIQANLLLFILHHLLSNKPLNKLTKTAHNKMNVISRENRVKKKEEIYFLTWSINVFIMIKELLESNIDAFSTESVYWPFKKLSL